MVIKFFYIAIAIIFFASCKKKDTQNIIAEVGDLSIKKDEFALIYEFNPHLAMVKNDSLAKQLVLQTLIAEKIFAQQEIEISLNKQEFDRRLSERYEQEAMIEKLWQDKILKEITIGEDELKKAYFKSKRKRIIKYLIFVNETEAKNAWHQIENKTSFEQLAESFGFSQQEIPADTISFGSEFPDLENIVFNMKVNQISKPIKMGQYYYIIKLAEEKINIFSSKNDFEKSAEKLKKIIKKRKSKVYFKKYVEQNLKGKRYKLDQDLFKNLVNHLEISIGFDTESKLPENIFSKTESVPEDLQYQTIVTFSNSESWNVKKLLQRLQVSPYPVDTRNRGSFRKSMILAAKSVLDDELLVQHAKENNLHNTQYVKIQSRMWNDYIKYKRTLKSVIDNYASNNNLSELTTQQQIDAIDEYLTGLIQKYPVEINYKMLDTLKLHKTDMVVSKSHFPNRTISPLLQPLIGLNKFSEHLFKKTND